MQTVEMQSPDACTLSDCVCRRFTHVLVVKEPNVPELSLGESNSQVIPPATTAAFPITLHSKAAKHVSQVCAWAPPEKNMWGASPTHAPLLPPIGHADAENLVQCVICPDWPLQPTSVLQLNDSIQLHDCQRPDVRNAGTTDRKTACPLPHAVANITAGIACYRSRLQI
jgi:hypothetical protein